MKLVCDCGNEAQFNEVTADNGDNYATLDPTKFQQSIISTTDDEGEAYEARSFICKQCNKEIVI